MNPALDYENAIKAILFTIADEISVEDKTTTERVLYAKIGDEIISRVIIHSPTNNYPIDISSKMPGFRISMTIRNAQDWGRNMAYLIDGYQNYREKAKRDLKFPM